LHILELPELGVLEALSYSNMYYLFSELFTFYFVIYTMANETTNFYCKKRKGRLSFKTSSSPSFKT